MATGQIVLWEGGSLWVFDVPGEADQPSRRAKHAHHAYQLTFSLGGAFNLHLEDRVLPGPFALVAPDIPHAFEARGRIAHLFIEPEGRAGRALSKLAHHDTAHPFVAEQVLDAPAHINAAFEHPDDPTSALRDVGIDICDRIAGHAHTTEPDRRVRQIIQWASNNLDSPLGISEAATHACLSPGRASHLFVKETGLPFRHYVLWLRLMRAVETYSRGGSLTEAAHEAGFSDSAHLSRTFKRMFGLPAASLKLS